jgi:DNA-binding NtrC family response regulator
VGGTRDLNVSVRVIAATNKDLAGEVKRGSFRLDLYHRLDVFHLRLPSLRERREDIVTFARHFLSVFAQRLGKPALRLAPETEAILGAYDYPGNIRELRNIIERAAILANRDVVEPSCIILSSEVRPESGARHFFTLDVAPNGQNDGHPPGQPPSLADLERAYIARLLEFTEGNRTQVARILGVSYPTVAKKIADYGL